jgi:hypothetical protein
MKLFIWSLFAWYSGAVMFYVGFFAYDPAVVETGLMDGLWTQGFASFSILIICHHGIIFISTKSYSWPIAIAYLFSLLCYFPITCCLMEYLPGTMYMSLF